MAKASGEDPWDTFFNLVRAGAFALPQSMTEANKIAAMQQEFVSFCTDVGPAGGSLIASHPRAFGAFPRLLSRYVRDQGAISLERAVAQASAAGANNVLAYDRGRIAEGLAADIIVFDYQQLADKATFSQPRGSVRRHAIRRRQRRAGAGWRQADRRTPRPRPPRAGLSTVGCDKAAAADGTPSHLRRWAGDSRTRLSHPTAGPARSRAMRRDRRESPRQPRAWHS